MPLQIFTDFCQRLNLHITLLFFQFQGDYDYANNQELLMSYHKSFKKVKNIMKREDGSLPTFWLISFRRWLQGSVPFIFIKYCDRDCDRF